MRFIRVLAALLAVCFLSGLLVGCCGGQPTVTLRNPFLIDSEPQTMAGPRYVQAPTYYAPTYTPAAPAALPPQFAPRAPGCP